MKDLIRKADRAYHQQVAPKQKSFANSPHLSFGITSAGTTMTLLRKERKTNRSQNFSMTVSFIAPRFDMPLVKDYAVKHQHIKQKSLAMNNDKTPIARRDPILQNNNEPTERFKPSYKLMPQSGRITLFDEEEPMFAKKKKRDLDAAETVRSVSPKIESIRTYARTYNEDEADANLEPSRRVRRGVPNSPQSLVNPIIGDILSAKTIKRRDAPEYTEHTKKANKRRMLSYCEGQTTMQFPKGRVFRDSSIDLSHRIATADDCASETARLTKKFNSPQHRKRDSVKGVLEYNFSGKYADQPISPKCTSMSFKEIVKNMNQSMVN